MTDHQGDARGVGPDGLTPYRVLNTRTRASAAVAYVAVAIVVAIVAIAIDLPALWFTGVLPLIVIAGIQVVAAWRMPITDMEAIRIASEEASFEVGHGSATLGYRGLLAKPIWQVLVFSDAPSPDREALVTVDAMTGDVTGHFEQAVEIP
mgnify:CR=1 FL=1